MSLRFISIGCVRRCAPRRRLGSTYQASFASDISEIGAESRPDIDSQFDEECDQGEKFRRIALPSFPRATGIRSTKRNIRPDYPRLSYVQIVADRARSSNRSRIPSLSVPIVASYVQSCLICIKRGVSQVANQVGKFRGIIEGGMLLESIHFCLLVVRIYS